MAITYGDKHIVGTIRQSAPLEGMLKLSSAQFSQDSAVSSIPVGAPLKKIGFIEQGSRNIPIVDIWDNDDDEDEFIGVAVATQYSRLFKENGIAVFNKTINDAEYESLTYLPKTDLSIINVIFGGAYDTDDIVGYNPTTNKYVPASEDFIGIAKVVNPAEADGKIGTIRMLTSTVIID